MDQRTLGVGGPTTSAVGLGCMSLTGAYGPVDPADATATVRAALDLGITVFDTADVYGPFANEQLVGHALGARRDEVAIVTKFGGAELADDGTVVGGACGRPDYVRHSVDRSLRNLGTDRIDLYLQHRADPSVPVEETFGALGELVAAGKVRHLGVSEVTAATIRRAHATAPLTAVETEYSLFSRDVEHNGVLAATRELGIGFLAYAPLGRGLLTGAVRPGGRIEADDLRSGFPRFQPGRLEPNLDLVGALSALASELGLTVGQLALSWLLTVATDVVALTGTRRAAHLAENVAAADVHLPAEVLRAVDALVTPGSVVGDRRSPADVGIQT